MNKTSYLILQEQQSVEVWIFPESSSHRRQPRCCNSRCRTQSRDSAQDPHWPAAGGAPRKRAGRQTDRGPAGPSSRERVPRRTTGCPQFRHRRGQFSTATARSRCPLSTREGRRCPAGCPLTKTVRAKLKETQSVRAKLKETQSVRAKLKETQSVRAKLKETQSVRAKLKQRKSVVSCIIGIILQNSSHNFFYYEPNKRKKEDTVSCFVYYWYHNITKQKS